ncbi:MAG: hypothetical protein ACXVDV_19335 [Bacteroidia bacterium]
MSNVLKNDATITTTAIIYQFYIALDKCFGLLKDEKVFIEKYGDVTVSGGTQIEVKDYSEDLTDLHVNIWKTLDNWLQEKFVVTHYKYLIILTTQKFSANSSFKEWNKKSKEERIKILTDIAQKYSNKNKKSENTEKLLNSVLDVSKKDKLIEVLDRFIILDSSPSSGEYYQQLVQSHGSSVLSANSEDYINALLGYIISPPITGKSGWEITYEEFTERKQSLISEYHSKTIIFPKKYSNLSLSQNNLQAYAKHLFVKKIEDIDYHEVRNEAIADFINTRKTISDELAKYSIAKHHYDGYESEILRGYLAKYRILSRSTSTAKLVKNSKSFFDEITAEKPPSFLYFNDTPIYFRNGLLHEITDDENKEIVWKLEALEDE